MMVSVPESTNIFNENDFDSSVIVETTSEPESKISSDFGDSSCGEPLVGQHLLIDFTLNDEIDTDYSQKKCCEFWDFINNIPEIQNLMAIPEEDSQTKELYTKLSTCERDKTEKVDKDTLAEKTAVSMLELVKEKGLIDRIFEAKLPKSMCSLGSREYKDTEESIDFKISKKRVKCPTKHKVEEQCACGGPCGVRSTKCIQLKKLVQSMEEWDSKHPKSMEPPGHPPPLHHCVLQRL